MITTLGGVLAASVLGSLHCAGMCGPLVSVAAAPVKLTRGGEAVERNDRGWWRSAGMSGLALATTYNVGRLVTYLVLGAGAGAIGGAFDFGGRLVGVQRGAIAVSGAILIAMGVIMLLEYWGVRVRAVSGSGAGALARTLARVQVKAKNVRAPVRAGLLGLMSGLLPCGWLYAFVVAAGGTGHVVDGMLVMLAFWVGTVPVLTVLGAGLHTALAPVRRHVPVATAVALVSVGMWSLIWRGGGVLRDVASAGESGQGSHCPLCEMKGR